MTKIHQMLERRELKRTVVLALCVLAASVAFAPAHAAAQGAADEYEYELLPEGTGENGGGTQSPTDVSTAGSDGGGPNTLLIVLAAVAAVCTGVAIWRLRKHGHHHDPI